MAATPPELDETATGPLGGAGPREVALPAGVVLADRHRVVRVLGMGGMGAVYEAEDLALGTRVALKTLHLDAAWSDAALARFKREVQVAQSITHPNVCRIYDLGFHGGGDGPALPYLTMELLDGESLAERLRRGSLAAGEALAVARAICAGLGAMHAAGVIHRDLKPGNVMLIDDDERRAVVTDFGLARAAGGDHPLPEGVPVAATAAVATAIAGTPAYMAPEQLAGAAPTIASDVYALGVVLHELVTRRRPPDGEDDVPPAWRPVIARCLAADPRARFAAAADVAAALGGDAGGAAGVRRRRGRRLAAGVAALAVIAVIAAGGVAIGLRGTVDAERARCDAAVSALDRVWTAAARADVRARHAGGEQPAWLDDFAQRWRIARRAACAADPTVAPRTQACLAEALDALRAAVPRTDGGWPALPRLEDCDHPPPAETRFSLTVGVGAQGVAALSPDGGRIAVSTFAGEPYIVSADPRASSATPVAGALVVGDWLPDGRMLLQHADGSQVLRNHYGDERALPGTGDLLHTQINTIAPDGARIAVAQGGAIVVLDAGGAKLATVPGDAHELAWEPDGRRLAVVSRDLQTLTLLDVATGARVAIPLGVTARNLGEIGLAWFAPGRLGLTGTAGPAGDYALWSLDLDDQSRLRRAPELRYRTPPGQLLRLYDVANGRVLLDVSSGRQRLLRWSNGRTTDYGARYKDVRLMALDRTTGTALAVGADELQLFAADDGGPRARTVLPAGTSSLLFGLREGHAWYARPVDATTWELDAAGTAAPPVRFAWPAEAGAPYVRCAAAAPDRCAVLGRVGEVLHVAPLDGNRVGAALRLDGVTGFPDVDGAGHVLAPAGARVVTIELATGARTSLADSRAISCTTRTVRVDPIDARRVWLVLLCADRFAIGDVTPGYVFREVTSSDGWVSGLEVTSTGDLVYSTMDWDPQLLLLDGLAP